jgi:hypothetical protein
MGAEVTRDPTMSRRSASSRLPRFGFIPASASTANVGDIVPFLGLLDDRDDCGLGRFAFEAVDLSAKSVRSTNNPDTIWGRPGVACVADLAQVVPLLGFDIEG